MEVYSCDGLQILDHLRWTGPPQKMPPDLAPSHCIGASSESRFTSPDKRLIVIRKADPIFQRHIEWLVGDSQSHLSDLVDFARAIAKYGKIDTHRSKAATEGEPPTSRQCRVGIGCIGQSYNPDGEPTKVVGLDFIEQLRQDNEFDEKNVIDTFGRIILFTNLALIDLQECTCEIPLGLDKNRIQQFSSHLADVFGIDHPHFIIEDAYAIVGLPYPNYDGCTKHTDVMSDWRPGYTRTAAWNLMLIDESQNLVLQLQVVVNFRKKVGDHTQPWARAAERCCHNIQHYIRLVGDNYRLIFQPNSTLVPTALDWKHFYLDDSLPFQEVTIYRAPDGGPVEDMCLLMPKISSSRVLSYSMYIEPIVLLKEDLAYDQLLELAFLASLMCTPLWFHPVLMELIENHRNQDHEFHFDEHPFFDVMELTIKKYNTQDDLDSGKKLVWQTALFKRFSPFGGHTSLPEMFGALPTSTKEQKQRGRVLLCRIVTVLFEYTEWIDCELIGRGIDPVHDLQLSYVEAKQEEVCARIKAIVPCQFRTFRLGGFTTVVSGAGLLKPGRHLRQLLIPASTCASYKHLMNTNGDARPFLYSRGKGVFYTPVSPLDLIGIPKEYHDLAMQMIAVSLNIPYNRDIIECLLVCSTCAFYLVFFSCKFILISPSVRGHALKDHPSGL